MPLASIDSLILNILSEPASKTRSIPDIKQVYFNKESGHTTIVLSDGSATVVRCGDGDSFEEYLGFCAAIVKKLFGSTSAAKKTLDTKDAEKQKQLKEAERRRVAIERMQLEARNRERRELREEGRVRKAFELISKYANIGAEELTKNIESILSTNDE